LEIGDGKKMIDFTYVVTQVNEDTNQIIIEYSSTGRKTINVGAPLPLNGISMDDYAVSYAPFSYWIEEEKGRYVPAVGISGSYSAPPPVMPKFEPNIESSESESVPTYLDDEQLNELLESLKK